MTNQVTYRYNIIIFFLLFIFISGYAQNKPNQHPRIFYTPANIASVKSGMNKPDVQKGYEYIISKADEFVASNNKRSTNLEILAFSYQMTKDSKYAGLAKEILFDLIEKPTWEGKALLSRSPQWQAGLDVSRVVGRASVAYDGIYGYLTPKERKQIANGLTEKGIKPLLEDWLLNDSRFHSLESMGHNWWSSCVFMAGIGCISVWDEVPEASAWFEQILNSEREWLEFSGNLLENKIKSFDSDGGFYEGVNYSSFGFSEYLFFRLAVRNSFPAKKLENYPVLQKTGEYFIRICYPREGELYSVNFGDTRLNVVGERPVKLLIENGIHTPDFDWYLEQIKPEQHWEGLHDKDPLGLIFRAKYKPVSKAEPDLPKSKLFSDMGWATMRDSWDKNATMLAVKSGFTWNHAHADAGSFILFHNGEYMLKDAGTCSYGNPNYTKYYCQSQAHNVVLFNGQGQNPEDDYYGVKNPGSVNNLIDDGYLKYVWADATGPYAQILSRNFRSFLWIGNVILVIDDLKSHEPGEFEWLLHYGGQAKKSGKDIYITKNNSQIIVRPLFPEPLPDGGLPHDFPELLKMEERTGLVDHEPDSTEKYLSFSLKDTKRREKFITAIIIPDKNSPKDLPTITRIKNNGLIGVQITQNGTTTDVYLNLMADGHIMHRPANNEFFGWQTDAYLLAFSYAEGTDINASPEKIENIFVANGSYLRNNGETIISSLSKVFLSYKPGNLKNITLQGQELINIELKTWHNPGVLKVNNSNCTWKYDSKRKSVFLKTDNQNQ